MLTSALKRVDVAVYKAFTDAKNGTWKPGQLVLGLAEDGVDYSYDEHNRTAPHARDEGEARRREGRHHQRQDQGLGIQGAVRFVRLCLRAVGLE